jgi:hypothetical protein
MFAAGVSNAGAIKGALPTAAAKGKLDRENSAPRGHSRGLRGAAAAAVSASGPAAEGDDDDTPKVFTGTGQSFRIRKKKLAPDIALPSVPQRTGNVAFKQTVLSDDVKATRFKARTDGQLEKSAAELVETQRRLFGVPSEVAARAVMGAREVEFHGAEYSCIVSPHGE